MKKIRIITFVLCAAMMSMGAGYAYWSDTLVINNTVATGDLNVKFTDAALTAVEADEQYIEFIQKAVADKDLTIEVGNLYPGAAFKLNATMKNVGTIPAVLHNFTVVKNMEDTLSGKAPLTDAQLTSLKVSGTIVNSTGYVYNILPEHDVTLVNLQEALNHDDIRLEPLETLTFDLTLTLDSLVKEEFENTYYKAVMKAEFKQHNVQ